MRKVIVAFAALTAMFCLSACKGDSDSHRSGDIELLRFEQILFETPEKELPKALAKFDESYKSPLLIIQPNDPMFMTQLVGFVADPIVREIYDATNHRYKNLYWLEAELTEALNKTHNLDEEIDIEHFATFVSASFDYSRRIAIDRDSRSLLLSIDQYAVGDMENYNYFGLPMFIVERCDSTYIASDIMAEVARQYIASPTEGDGTDSEKSPTMLDLMISEGKVLYFLDQVMPKKEDHVKIRYSEEQMKWMRDNESKVWSYFIQNDLLYEKDYTRYHNFIDEAPKTNAFKDSAPRTTQYIGWQIVRRYMSANKCSMKELFDNKDSQAILTASKYRP